MALYEVSSQLIPLLFVAFVIELGIARLGARQPGRTALLVAGVVLVAFIGEAIALLHVNGATPSPVVERLHDASLVILGLVVAAASVALPLELARGSEGWLNERVDKWLKLILAVTLFLIVGGVGALVGHAT